MKTTYNKREIAQRERAKNLAIYNEAAAIAREVFNRLDIEAGTYNAAQVATAIYKEFATVDENAGDWFLELVKIENDGFFCSFPRGSVFDILNKMGTGYNIPSSARVIFERTAEENERHAAAVMTAAEAQAEAERQAQAEAERQAREAEEKRARRRENDRRRRAAKKAQAEAERAQAQAEAEAAEAARRAAMTPADIEREKENFNRRLQASARRADFIRRHSVKMSCGSNIELINKIIVVTVSAYGENIVKCWAVGLDSYYFVSGKLTENNYLKDTQRSYKKECREAVANWIYLTRQAAQKNGWNINIYSETPAAAAGYFVPSISAAIDDAIKRAQAEAQRPALVPADIETPANDDAAAPSIERDSETRRRAKSWNDIEAQHERIKAAAFDIVIKREGHSDGRTKEDRRLYNRLSAAGFIKNLYLRRIMFYEARQGKRRDRAALVPASIFAPLVPDMRAETAAGVKFSFIASMEPGGWEPSANTFAELCEGLKHSETNEFCRAEIERRAIEAAHKFTAELGTIDRSATANELTAVFLSGVDRWAAETAPRFASVDDFINNMLPTMTPAANDDTAAPAEVANDDSETDTPAAVLVPVAFVDVCETPANDDTAAPGFAAAPIETPAPLHFWSSTNDDTRRPAVVLGIETGDTTANDDTAANGHRNRHGARRWFQVAAAIVAAFLLSLFSDIERETPATAAPVELATPANDDTANDGTPATATETATDSAATAAPIMTPPTMEKPATAKKRQPRARRHRAALSADIERETPAAPSAEVANDDTAAPVLAVEIATPANDDTPAPVDTTAAPLSADIETSETDTAAPVEIQTPANDDTANDGTPAPLSADIETSETDTAAPAEVANDDTANDGTPAPSSETPATGGTPSPSTPATTGTPAPVPVSPAVLAWLLML
jgi:hypothetical protein